MCLSPDARRRESDLADIVQHRSHSEPLDVLRFESELGREQTRQGGDAARVEVAARVTRVRRGHEGPGHSQLRVLLEHAHTFSGAERLLHPLVVSDHKAPPMVRRPRERSIGLAHERVALQRVVGTQSEAKRGRERPSGHRYRADGLTDGSRGVLGVTATGDRHV